MRRLLLCCLPMLPVCCAVFARPAAAQDVNAMPTTELNYSGAPVLKIDRRPELRVSHGWIVAAPARADTTGYLLIDNQGDADRLVGATCSHAQGTTMSQTRPRRESMAGMRPMDSKGQPILLGIEIPAKGRVELKPQGLHLNIQDVEEALVPGEQVGCRLDFRIGGPVDVSMAVLPPGATPPP